jgi:hypothetical protein
MFAQATLQVAARKQQIAMEEMRPGVFGRQ